ncbi:MAG: ThiF family adenylyltransferase [Chloroflexi bacterium]|nr:ThiF family adenylyltransferase [Chloroflexota bacterium]
MEPNERERYLRQIIFPSLGAAGQERLLAGRVVLIGCGANGTVMANTLARAGVGTLIIVDRDYVELNNLQRQVLFDEADVTRGMPKAIAAAEKLARVNSSIRIEGRAIDVNAENIEELIQGASLVLDGTDNFETRFLINDACVKNRIPWIYAGAVGSTGMTMTIVPYETACLRCIFQHEPPPGTLPTCDTAGVIAPIVNVMASLACAEAIKLLVGAGERNPGLIHVDVWENSFEVFAVTRRSDCVTCGQDRFEYLEGERPGATAVSLCGRNAIQVNPGRGHQLDLAAIAQRLSSAGSVSANEYLVRLTADNYELTIFPDARAIIKGTDDPAIARSLYSKYVGV